MLDAAALLWRLHLQRHDVGNRWTELADTYEATAEAGFYAFNDMHAMMAFAATGRQTAAAATARDVERAAAGSATNAVHDAPGSDSPIVRAIDAFGRGRYGTRSIC